MNELERRLGLADFPPHYHVTLTREGEFRGDEGDGPPRVLNKRRHSDEGVDSSAAHHAVSAVLSL